MLALVGLSLSFAGAPRAAVVPRAGAPAMAVARGFSVAAPTKPKPLVEPVFPEVCEYAGITLSRYVLEMARANPDKPELVELVSVMTSIERACKTISNLVRKAPISGSALLGLEEGGGTRPSSQVSTAV